MQKRTSMKSRLDLWQTTDTTAGPSGRPGTTGLPSAVTDESMGVCRTVLLPFVIVMRCPRNLPAAESTKPGCLRPILAQTPRPGSGNSPSPREVCSAGQITDRAGPLRIYCSKTSHLFVHLTRPTPNSGPLRNLLPGISSYPQKLRTGGTLFFGTAVLQGFSSL